MATSPPQVIRIPCAPFLGFLGVQLQAVEPCPGFGVVEGGQETLSSSICPGAPERQGGEPLVPRIYFFTKSR